VWFLFTVGRGQVLYSRDFLIGWLIAPAQFERWVNVLADNDNAPAAPESCPRPAEEIPAVTGLSSY
jgi:hypothetical protein